MHRLRRAFSITAEAVQAMLKPADAQETDIVYG
jgi:hypothetical protein